MWIKRTQWILKIASLVLAVLVFLQFARLIAGRNPLRDLQLPVVEPATSSAAPSTPQSKPSPEEPPKPGSRGAPAAPPGPPGDPPGRNPGSRGQRDGGRGPALAEPIQAGVDRVTQSEILAPVQRPLPMALLGIAGPDVFLRAPNGQTGLVKVGDELGGVKLVQIGINRVLVELDGKQQELTIFEGMGGNSLAPQGKEKQP